MEREMFGIYNRKEPPSVLDGVKDKLIAGVTAGAIVMGATDVEAAKKKPKAAPVVKSIPKPKTTAKHQIVTKNNNIRHQPQVPIHIQGFETFDPKYVRMSDAELVKILKGNMDAENAFIEQLGLIHENGEFALTDEEVKEMKKSKNGLPPKLISITKGDHGFYFVDENMGIDLKNGQKYKDQDTRDEVLYVTRPEIKEYFENIAREFNSAFPGWKLIITALTRSVEYQQWLMLHNSNADKRSVHPTSAAFDFSKFVINPNGQRVLLDKNSPMLRYLRVKFVIEMGGDKKITEKRTALVTEEDQQKNFHWIVSPKHAKTGKSS